jgi:hypothetical protein
VSGAPRRSCPWPPAGSPPWGTAAASTAVSTWRWCMGGCGSFGGDRRGQGRPRARAPRVPRRRHPRLGTLRLRRTPPVGLASVADEGRRVVVYLRRGQGDGSLLHELVTQPHQEAGDQPSVTGETGSAIPASVDRSCVTWESTAPASAVTSSNTGVRCRTVDGRAGVVGPATTTPSGPRRTSG